MNNEARKDDKEQRYFVVCKLCDRKFRTISAHHLWAAHYGKNIRHPVLYYKKTFQVAHPWSYRTRVLQRRSSFKTLRLAGRRWTNGRIIKTIRQRWEREEDLSTLSMIKTDPRLLSAAVHHFHSWRAALTAAGLDPDRCSKYRTWNKDKVIAAIRRRAGQGLDMSSYSVRASDHPLSTAARSCFGGWFIALKAAGLDPNRYRKHQAWNNRKVIEGIRRLAMRGLDMSASTIQTSNHALYRAAGRRFGGWFEALRAAGIDPGQYRKHQVWDKRKVIEGIRRLAMRGLDMSAPTIQTSNHALYRAAGRRFGGWFEALKAIGINPDQYRKLQVWDKRKVLERIRHRARRGLDMCYSAVRTSDRTLLVAAQRRFGGWFEALKAIGINPDQYRKLQVWDKSKVLECIRHRAESGLDMCYSAMRASDQPLLTATEQRFGGWYNALKAAGIDPDQYRKLQAWDKSEVVERIRHRAESGLDMCYSAMQASAYPLLRAAERRFGGWFSALKAAGIDPDRYRKLQAWDKSKVLERIRHRAESGLDMCYSAMRASDQPLLTATEQRFGGWYNALKAAGIDPDRYRKCTVWTDDKVLSVIRDVYRYHGKTAASILGMALVGAIHRRGWTIPQARAMAGLPADLSAEARGAEVEPPTSA